MLPRWIIVAVLAVVAAVALLQLPLARAQVAPLWVNDLEYGSIGGGFYWDPQSTQVWTGERGWHPFSPQPPRNVTPLWVNDLEYGSVGGGFYLDPLSTQVWTSERGWHYFSRGVAPRPPAPPPPSPDPRSTFGDGINVVGTDVIAGVTYRTRTLPDGCYWARLSGFTGEFEDIIANDFTYGYSVVTIGANDAGFESDGCGTWTRDLSAVTSGPTAPVTADGVYIVGTDISPGLWRAEGVDGCYWARLSGFTGEFDDIIANDFRSSGSSVVQILPSDVGFETSGCTTWTRVS
jgi:hypothetical protein